MNLHAAQPQLLTAGEVAKYLRLVDDTATPEELESARRSVHRLVRDGRLRPVRPSKEYVFADFELARFVRTETENWQTAHAQVADAK